MSAAAKIKNTRAVVIHGRCRDLEELRAHGVPVRSVQTFAVHIFLSTDSPCQVFAKVGTALARRQSKPLTARAEHDYDRVCQHSDSHLSQDLQSCKAFSLFSPTSRLSQAYVLSLVASFAATRTVWCSCQLTSSTRRCKLWRRAQRLMNAA